MEVRSDRCDRAVGGLVRLREHQRRPAARARRRRHRLRGRDPTTRGARAGGPSAVPPDQPAQPRRPGPAELLRPVRVLPLARRQLRYPDHLGVLRRRKQRDGAQCERGGKAVERALRALSPLHSVQHLQRKGARPARPRPDRGRGPDARAGAIAGERAGWRASDLLPCQGARARRAA